MPKKSAKSTAKSKKKSPTKSKVTKKTSVAKKSLYKDSVKKSAEAEEMERKIEEDQIEEEEGIVEPGSSERVVPTFLAPSRPTADLEEDDSDENTEESNENLGNEKIEEKLDSSGSEDSGEEVAGQEDTVEESTEDEQNSDDKVQLDTTIDPEIAEEDNTEAQDSDSSSFSSFMGNASSRSGGQIVKDEKILDKSINKQEGSKKPFYIFVGVLVVLILAMLGVVVYRNSNTEVVQTETDLQSRVAELAVIPGESDPYTGLIVDADKVISLDKDLFADLVNGYSILIYPDNQLVVVFDDVLGKVVLMARVEKVSNFLENTGISFDQEIEGVPSITSTLAPTQAETDSVKPTETVTIELRNGSSSSGITLSFQADIEKQSDLYDVISRSTAANTYEFTVVYNLSGSASAQDLADFLNATVEDVLPGNEISTDADILIILGEDQV